MATMKTLKFPGSSNIYEMVDATARAGVASLQTTVGGLADDTAAANAAASSALTAASSALTNFAGAFSASTAYTAGQYVTYTDGKLYRFTTNHAAGAWNSAHVVAVTAGGELTDLKSALEAEKLVTAKVPEMQTAYEELGAVISPNLYNEQVVTKGKIILTDGSESTNATYSFTDYLPVTVGEYITMFPVLGGNSSVGFKDICVYDANKNFIYRFSDIYDNAQVTKNSDGSATYLIGNRVAYVRLNIVAQTPTERTMLNMGTFLKTYAPYGFISQNVFNYKTATYNKIVNTSGVLVDSNFFVSDFIYVGEGNSITVMPTTGGSIPKGVKDISVYGASKNFLFRFSDIVANNADGSYTLVAGNNVEYVRLNFNITTDEETVMVNLGNKMLSFVPWGAYSLENRLEEMAEKTETLEKEPSIVFDTDYALHDFSSVINSMNWSDGINQSNILEQTYALYDGLVSSYPAYASKEDVAQTLGLSYPAYANGTVEGVPQYKVYMYKLIFNDPAIGTSKHKKKVLIISGVHGNEIAAPVNTYLIAKQLCEATDANFYKLRSAFDFYIIPCLNGYGMYKITRGNGNNVNINRNYPIRKWAVRGADTQQSQWANEYTGASAGSEFETQIIMQITAQIQPDMCIDHHNYGSNLEKQFYVEAETEAMLPVIYQELAECMIAFKKALPQYFGTSYQMLTDGEAPKETANDMNGTTSRYWYENGIENATTLEISQSINYVNGAFNGGQDLFGSDTFAVAEYNFRNHLMKIGQYVLKH